MLKHLATIIWMLIEMILDTKWNVNPGTDSFNNIPTCSQLITLSNRISPLAKKTTVKHRSTNQRACS